MQFQADVLGVRVVRPKVFETTALGAAYLAGLQSGFYPEPARFAERWALDTRFTPAMEPSERTRLLSSWHDAVDPEAGEGRPLHLGPDRARADGPPIGLSALTTSKE